jgi:predicted nucleic acid-binding Zn ribbon protein
VSRGPRRFGEALRAARAEVAPRTLLAAVQGVWAEVAGVAVAAEGDPVTERDGVITVACRSATWAHELDLLQDELLTRLNAALSGSERERPGGSWRVEGLRFTADAARHER